MYEDSVRRMDKLRNMAHLEHLIKFYLMLGLRHGEIVLLLSTVDNIVISMCILSMILKCNGLYRRMNDSDLLKAGHCKLIYLCWLVTATVFDEKQHPGLK